MYVMVVRATGPAQLQSARHRKTVVKLLVVWLVSLVYSARILIVPSAEGDFELEDESHADEGDHDDDEEGEETCILFIETDVDDVPARCVDLVLLYVLPIAVQIFFYVKVARKLWSSQVRHHTLTLDPDLCSS